MEFVPVEVVWRQIRQLKPEEHFFGRVVHVMSDNVHTQLIFSFHTFRSNQLYRGK